MNFIVGGCIRRLQQKKVGERPRKYSFVVHTEASKASHQWQEEIASSLVRGLEAQCGGKGVVQGLVSTSYAELAKSVGMEGGMLPSKAEVQSEVEEALREEWVIITKVNSEREVRQLLDEKNGQLKLTSPLNIFIGGQILDRGITIENLIGFYYGRRPYKFQQDTVLQHSRMFGARSQEDLAVTRFYTSLGIYEVMRKINEFDSALRKVFENGPENAGVVFICADTSNRIIACSPNKILLSKTTTLTPFKRMLPKGFNTDYKSNTRLLLSEVDKIIGELEPPDNGGKPFLIDVQVAKIVVDQIAKLLVFDKESDGWDTKAFKASMQYLAHNTENVMHKDRVWCLVRRNRNNSRLREDGTYFDSPDTGKVETALAREVATDIPMLMLFRQNGEEAKGWKGSPFWWPVLMASGQTRPVIFASELID